MSLEVAYEIVKTPHVSTSVSLLHACGKGCEPPASCSGHHAYSFFTTRDSHKLKYALSSLSDHSVLSQQWVSNEQTLQGTWGK